MTTRLMEGGLRSPEAAKRLGIRGRDVYRMLFEGELDGGPGRDGMVYFDEASIDGYLDRHGFGVVAEPSTGSSTGSAKTGDHEAPPTASPKARKRSSEVQADTEENGPSSGSTHS